eukprot:3604468-Rhodomonas_salina.6
MSVPEIASRLRRALPGVFVEVDYRAVQMRVWYHNACQMRVKCVTNACLMRIKCVTDAYHMRVKCVSNACQTRVKCMSCSTMRLLSPRHSLERASGRRSVLRLRA